MAKNRTPAVEQPKQTPEDEAMRDELEEEILNGTAFNEADPNSNVLQMPERTKESDRANQEAARAAIAAMKRQDPSVTREPNKPVLEPLSAKEAEAIRPALYVVRRPIEVARNGRMYTLKPGKVVSANEYDIKALLRAAEPGALVPYEGT